MDHFFDLPVIYDAAQHNFSAEYIPSAYSYRIAVDVFGNIVLFEPDEEGNFRAVLSPDDLLEGKMIDREWLEAIANQLMQIFKD